MVSALTAVLMLFGIIEKMIVENTMHAKSLWHRESLINTCLTVYLKNPNWNYNMSTNQYKLGRKSG